MIVFRLSNKAEVIPAVARQMATEPPPEPLSMPLLQGTETQLEQR